MFVTNAVVNGVVVFVLVIITYVLSRGLRHALHRRRLLDSLGAYEKRRRFRIYKPSIKIVTTIGNLVARLVPKFVSRFTTTQLLQAGFVARRDFETFMAIEAGLILVSIGLVLSQATAAFGLLGMVLIFATPLFIPRLYLITRRNSRQNQMVRELPMMVDLMTQVVNGGLGLNGAMDKAIQHQSGVLVGELNRTREDMVLGMSRSEAFQRLSQRVSNAEIRRFSEAVMKVDQLGVSLNLVLSAQARAIRLRRLTDARVRTERVSVKILLPVILCFLPGVFIVAVAPAVFSIISALQGP